MTPPSVWQVVLILAIVVLLFGAKKIPELAKGLGSGVKNFKKAMKEDEDENAQGAQNPPVTNAQNNQNLQNNSTTNASANTNAQNPQNA